MEDGLEEQRITRAPDTDLTNETPVATYIDKTAPFINPHHL